MKSLFLPRKNFLRSCDNFHCHLLRFSSRMMEGKIFFCWNSCFFLLDMTKEEFPNCDVQFFLLINIFFMPNKVSSLFSLFLPIFSVFLHLATNRRKILIFQLIFPSRASIGESWWAPCVNLYFTKQGKEIKKPFSAFPTLRPAQFALDFFFIPRYEARNSRLFLFFPSFAYMVVLRLCFWLLLKLFSLINFLDKKFRPPLSPVLCNSKNFLSIKCFASFHQV